MATTSPLLNTFKVKIDDAVALVPTMVAEEKLKAVQFWNVISERLQEIVNNSAADISALAFELEKQNAAKQTNGETPTVLNKPEESLELKMPVQESTPLPAVDQQVNSQLPSYTMEMTNPPVPPCKPNTNPLLPPSALPSPSPTLVPSYPAKDSSTLPVVPAGQILQAALNQEPPPSIHLANHEQDLSSLITNENETSVFIEAEEEPKTEKKLTTRSKKLKPANSGIDKWEPENEKILATRSHKTRSEMGKAKSPPSLRRQPPRNKRKKKNFSLATDSDGSDLESTLNSIKEGHRQANGCIVEKTESEDGGTGTAKISLSNETEGNHSSGIILMNAKSLRGTGEGECFDDSMAIDDDVEPVMDVGDGDDDDDEDDEEEEEEESEEFLHAKPFINEDGHYICCMCKKTCVSMAIYTTHKCSNKAYTCTECHARFSTRGNLIVHLRRHTGEKPFSCAQCHAKFSTKGNLKRHIKTHSGERPWECVQCGGRFTEKKSLKVHMRRHTGEKPYKCTVCGKEFAQTGILQTHMAMHMDQKEHLCEHCGKSFRQKSQLRLHMMRHDGVRKFQCNTCPSKFLTKGDLERHNRTHTGERPFICEICAKAFTRQQSLNEHMNRHYGVKPYQCKYCGKGFAEMSACYKHIKQHERYQDNASNDGDSQQLSMACDTKKLTVLVHDQSLDVGSEISVQQEQSSSVINDETDTTVVPDNMGDFTAMNLLANASSFQQSY